MSDDEGSSPRGSVDASVPAGTTPATASAKSKRPVKKQPLQTVLMDLWKKIQQYVRSVIISGVYSRIEHVIPILHISYLALLVSDRLTRCCVRRWCRWIADGTKTSSSTNWCQRKRFPSTTFTFRSPLPCPRSRRSWTVDCTRISQSSRCVKRP